MKNKNTILIVFSILLYGCSATKNNINNNFSANTVLPFHYYYDCDNNLSFTNKFNRVPTNSEKLEAKDEVIVETKEKHGIDLINCIEKS